MPDLSQFRQFAELVARFLELSKLLTKIKLRLIKAANQLLRTSNRLNVRSILRQNLGTLTPKTRLPKRQIELAIP